MHCAARWIAYGLPLLLAPAAGKTQFMVGMVRPPLEIRIPDYRLRATAGHVDRSNAAPAAMLARLFATPAATAQRGRGAFFAVGGIMLSAETLRARMPTAIGERARATPALDRLSALGIRAAWPLGDRDGLALGIAADMSKRAAPAILAGRKSIHGQGFVADCTWTHDALLRISLDWRVDRSSSADGIRRAVELAQGAALSERDLGLTLSYRAAGSREESPRTTFGIAVHDARIAADDLAAIASDKRRNDQAALFLRAAF